MYQTMYLPISNGEQQEPVSGSLTQFGNDLVWGTAAIRLPFNRLTEFEIYAFSRQQTAESRHHYFYCDVPARQWGGGD